MHCHHFKANDCIDKTKNYYVKMSVNYNIISELSNHSKAKVKNIVRICLFLFNNVKLLLEANNNTIFQIFNIIIKNSFKNKYKQSKEGEKDFN